MGITEGGKKIRNTICTVLAILLALFVLFVSISRGSLEVAQNEDKNRRIRKIEIEATDGEKTFFYNIPQVWVLPDNSIYGLKKFRDYIWIHSTEGGKKRSEVSLFIADKKIAEAKVLLSKNKTELAIETSREALNLLKYARNENKNEQVYQAGFAYAKILESYKQKIEELDEWNQKEKETH